MKYYFKFDKLIFEMLVIVFLFKFLFLFNLYRIVSLICYIIVIGFVNLICLMY